MEDNEDAEAEEDKVHHTHKQVHAIVSFLHSGHECGDLDLDKCQAYVNAGRLFWHVRQKCGGPRTHIREGHRWLVEHLYLKPS